MNEVVIMLQNGAGGEEPMIFCPACMCGHLFPKDLWQWNGDKVRPTFTPSMRVYAVMGKPECHSNVTDGSIYFHGDSGHEMRGKTVALRGFTVEEGIVG